jgi:hypothetical protein
MFGRPLIAALAVWSGSGAAIAAEPFVLTPGMSVEQALEALRAAGLQLVYSSAMVPPALQVRDRVSGSDPAVVARELLAPHGLRLRPISSGLLAVVAVRTDATRSIAGRVVSGLDRHPVAGARIEVTGRGHVEWSDVAGDFRVPASAGHLALAVSAPGYGTLERTIDDAESTAGAVTLELVPEDVQLEEVRIVASQFALRNVIEAPHVMDRANVIAQPKVAEDPLQAVARLPGMALSGVSGKPNVRGGEAGEALVLLDQMPIREAFHLPDYNSAFSVLDENLVADITTFTGPLPARFGNRMAAAVEVQSVAPDTPAPYAIGLSNFNARLRVGGSAASGWDWLASGRIGTLGSWLPEVVPDVGKPQSWDAFFKVGHALGGGTEMRAHSLLSKSTFAFVDDETGEQAVLRSQAAYAWLHARHLIGDDMETGALFGHSWIGSERAGVLAGGLTPFGKVADERTARIWDVQLYGRWATTPRNQLDAGITLASSTGRYRYASDVEYLPVATALFSVPHDRQRSSALVVQRKLVGLYLSDRWQPLADIYVEGGARLDRDIASTGVRASYLGPRLAMRWDASPQTTVRFSWGRAFQVAEAHELRVEDGELALPAAQRVDQTVVSLERQFLHGLSLRMEAFDRKMPDPRVRYENLFDPLRVLPELSADRVSIVPDRSRMRGLEFSAQWEEGCWSASGSYTWSEAIDFMGGESRPREWDQRSTMTAALRWQQGPWSAVVQTGYRSGRPTTPFIDASLESPALGPAGSRRFAHHVTFDVRLTRRFHPGSGTLVAFAQVTNLLDRYNQCCTELDMPDENSDRQALEIQRLGSYPLMPSVGLSYEF